MPPRKSPIYETHALEDVLEIETGTTEAPNVPVIIIPKTAIQPENYDAKDMEIESNIEEVYAMAMATVQDLTTEIMSMDQSDRGKARMVEVTATMLNVALSATSEKAKLKIHKDKTNTESENTKNINNLIIADRNSILTILGQPIPEEVAEIAKTDK